MISGFSWPEFLLLMVAGGGSSIVSIPYSLRLLKSLTPATKAREDSSGQLVESLMRRFIGLPIAIGLGLLLAHSLGLGAPLLETLLAQQPISQHQLATLTSAILAGIIIGLVLFFFTPRSALTRLQNVVFCLQSGVTDEILLRLFSFSFLAWLLSKVFNSAALPSLQIFWTANIFVALLSALNSISAQASMSILNSQRVSPQIVMRILSLEALPGLVYGYLYWHVGLEAAMCAHLIAALIPTLGRGQQPSADTSSRVQYASQQRETEAQLVTEMDKGEKNKERVADPPAEFSVTTLKSWLLMPTYHDQRRFLEAHLELLDSRSDEFLIKLVAISQEHQQDFQQIAGSTGAGNVEIVQDIRAHQKLLRDIHIRHGSIEAIRTMYVNACGGFTLDMPPWLEEVIHELNKLSNTCKAEQTAAARTLLVRDALSQARQAPNLAPEIIAELQGELGTALQNDPLTKNRQQLKDAMSAYKAALRVYTRKRYPQQWLRYTTLTKSVKAEIIDIND